MKRKPIAELETELRVSRRARAAAGVRRPQRRFEAIASIDSIDSIDSKGIPPMPARRVVELAEAQEG